MDWQPIETAPENVPVELGWWDSYGGKAENLFWRSGPGIVRRGIFTGRKRAVEFGRDHASHWRPLPPPPSGAVVAYRFADAMLAAREAGK
jgi:hypothetical protein